MNLCSDGHGELCYEGRNCPACDIVDEIEKLQLETERLRSEIEHLESALEEK